MDMDTQALAARYRAMNDDQLRSIALQIDCLTDVARKVLKFELALRRIDDVAEYQAERQRETAQINAHRDTLYQRKVKSIGNIAFIGYSTAICVTVFCLVMLAFGGWEEMGMMLVLLPPIAFVTVFVKIELIKLVWKTILRKEKV